MALVGLGIIGFGAEYVYGHFIKADSGIEACRTLAASGSIDGLPGADHPQASYQRIRREFDGSRYPNVRVTGTRFIDLSWRMGSFRQTGDEGNDLLYSQATGAYYGALVEACGGHGVRLPAMS